MTSKIIQRISKKAGVENLVDVLSSSLSGSDLQSLLLEVYRRRAGTRSASELLAEYTQNRFARSAKLDPLVVLEFDRIAFDLLPAGFERIALSPVAPLGTSSVVATVDQNVVVATIRNTEVMSDSTNAMALECAVRRRALLREHRSSADRIRLAASHRLVRAQAFDGPMQWPHFQVFALTTAGRDTGALRFESENVAEHVDYHVRLIRDGMKVAPESIRVALTPLTAEHDAWSIEHLIPDLQQRTPGVRFELDRERASGRNYYQQICFKVFATTDSREEIELGDGGLVPWTQRMLSNRKERLVISGMGTERACEIFGRRMMGASA